MARSVFDPGYQQQSVDSKIIAALERIAEAFRVLLWRETRVHGLSPIQIQLLVFLNFHPPEQRTVTYLAREFNLTKATISDALGVLDRKRLIRKAVRVGDSRSFLLDLTDKGKKTVHRVAMFANAFRPSMASLTREQKETLLAALLQTILHLHRAGTIAIQRMCPTCRFYREGRGRIYCTWFKIPLKRTDLRVDCPKHEAVYGEKTPD
jgi:DNA-binding MarR family transcriptional regulator